MYQSSSSTHNSLPSQEPDPPDTSDDRGSLDEGEGGGLFSWFTDGWGSSNDPTWGPSSPPSKGDDSGDF